jgi:hypothetical protein
VIIIFASRQTSPISAAARRVQTDNLALAVNNYTARSREPKNSLGKHRARRAKLNFRTRHRENEDLRVLLSVALLQLRVKTLFVRAS